MLAVEPVSDGTRGETPVKEAVLKIPEPVIDTDPVVNSLARLILV
jgi:hypothetical protein